MSVHASPTRRLPRQPNLQQLRKQAKDLLEQYRTGQPAAVAEVQQFDRAPHPAELALHDAQRVLARAYGYDSWPKFGLERRKQAEICPFRAAPLAKIR